MSEDLPRGVKAEDIAERYLKDRRQALEVFRIPGHHPEFDMIALLKRGMLKRIEVKYDFKEKSTGNIAIEHEHRGYFSGILVSKADWYIIVLTDKLLCMKKDDLFYFIRENEFKEVKWDGDMSTFKLVPTDELIAAGFCDIYDYKRKKDIEQKEASKYLHDFA